MPATDAYQIRRTPRFILPATLELDEVCWSLRERRPAWRWEIQPNVAGVPSLYGTLGRWTLSLARLPSGEWLWSIWSRADRSDGDAGYGECALDIAELAAEAIEVAEGEWMEAR